MDTIPLTAIVAIAQNHAIGINNQLPWPHIKEDMQRFVTLTKGKPIIMGSKTFESLPESSKPLKDRKTIVLSRSNDYSNYENTYTCNEFSESITCGEKLAREMGAKEVIVAGGEQIYKMAIYNVSKIYFTLVHESYPAHSFFPRIAPHRWHKTDLETFKADNGLTITFCTLTRME